MARKHGPADLSQASSPVAASQPERPPPTIRRRSARVRPTGGGHGRIRRAPHPDPNLRHADSPRPAGLPRGDQTAGAPPAPPKGGPEGKGQHARHMNGEPWIPPVFAQSSRALPQNRPPAQLGAQAGPSPSQDRQPDDRTPVAPPAPGTACAAQSSGFSPASIEARRPSRKGGSARLVPRLSSGSSTANPGPSVAISNRLPPGSRK